MSNRQSNGLTLSAETVALPSSRQERAKVIDTLLSSGGVQKLVAEVGKDIKILRWVKASDRVPTEVITDSLVADARNNELDSLTFPDETGPLFKFFKAFNVLAKFDSHAVGIIVQSKSELRAWLGVDVLEVANEIFCVPIYETGSIPEKTVIVVGGDNNLSEVSRSVMFLFE